jgi:hypothetical protein
VGATATPEENQRHQPHQLGSKPPSRCDERSRSPLELMQSNHKGTTRFGKRPVKQARTGENPDFRALLQLSVRSPPTSLDAWRSRCSPGLFPLRGLTTRSLDSRPPLLCFPHDLDPPPKRQAKADQRHSRVSIRPSLRMTPKTHPSLPEVSHLVRMPPNSLRSTPAS